MHQREHTAHDNFQLTDQTLRGNLPLTVVVRKTEICQQSREAELHEAKDLDLESRRRVFKALLLKYHPDKNPGNEAVSSITSQFVMKQKEWLSVAA